MTTDTDPRVEELMALVKRLLDKEDADPLSAYWAIESKITALIAKVPCIASDPRCPCNDGDTCNYVATKKTPAFEVPHPDATQLISIADLLPTLSGADPAMLTNVGHYLRGLSDRVKVLPVARTGPLRVAAEAVSAPVEAVPLSQAEHEVIWRAMRRAANIVRPSADEAMSRRQFEAFHAGRKNRGAKRRSEMFNQLADGTYADESESRHWWTWQTAVAVAREAPSGRTVVDSAVILAIDKRLTEAFAPGSRAEALLKSVIPRPTDEQRLAQAEAMERIRRVPLVRAEFGRQENEIDRLETEVARLTAERDVLLKCIEAANQNLAGHSRQIDVLTAELQEVQKDASPAMCQAALDASRQYNESEAPLPRGRELWAAAIVWRAMLAAAPEATKS